MMVVVPVIVVSAHRCSPSVRRFDRVAIALANVPYHRYSIAIYRVVKMLSVFHGR
jgi:hypothetical protein